MALTITEALLAVTLVSSLTGCGAFTNDTTVEIQMYGIPTIPSGATGTSDPQFQTYEVQSISLNGDSLPFTLVDSPSSFKIVDRPQILVSRDASKYEGQTFTSLNVVFAPHVTGGNKSASDLSFDLTTSTVSLTESISIQKGNTKTFIIKAAWANTISTSGTAVMTEPSLQIVDE